MWCSVCLHSSPSASPKQSMAKSRSKLDPMSRITVSREAGNRQRRIQRLRHVSLDVLACCRQHCERAFSAVEPESHCMPGLRNWLGYEILRHDKTRHRPGLLCELFMDLSFSFRILHANEVFQPDNVDTNGMIAVAW